MNRHDALYDLTLMMLYLSSWEEAEGSSPRLRAWKGYDFDILDELYDDKYTYGNKRNKSVFLTEEGIAQARELLAAYDIAIDPDPETQRFFRLHLRLDFGKLTCMRTLLVPMHTTFEDFHTQIQACLNWLNCQIYNFSFEFEGHQFYVSWPDYETGGDPRKEFWMPECEQVTYRCSQTTYLDDFLPAVREMVYSYDCGDGWQIKISLLNQKEPHASDVPFCWDGVGDAPPEDVGGDRQGYEHFSKLATNRRLARWQEFARTDIDMMPREAQRAAFGKVLAEPRRRH